MRARAGLSAAALITALATGAAQAACPIELAVYGSRDDVGSIDFRPRGEAVAVTNAFRMLLGDGLMLDGIVMWSADESRPNGMLMHDCPEGDVTGEEIAACTAWAGVIYTSDASGNIGLLPAQGSPAPPTLIFPDLGPALKSSSA